jgi:hypothetical protein
LLSESILPSETVGSTSVGISTVYNLWVYRFVWRAAFSVSRLCS